MGEVEWKYKFTEAKEHCKLSHDERRVFHVLLMNDSGYKITMVFIVQWIYIREEYNSVCLSTNIYTTIEIVSVTTNYITEKKF